MGIFDKRPAAAPATAPQTPPPQANGQQWGNEDDDAYGDIGNEAKKAGGNRLPWFTDKGTHIVCVDRVIGKKDRKKIDRYIIETRVVHCDNPAVQPGAPRGKQESSDKDGWLSRVAQFIMGATGCSADDIDKAGTHSTFSPDQPLAGILLACDVVPNPEKADKQGNPFMNTYWRALNAAEFQRFAPMMKALDPGWQPNGVQPGLGA